MFNPQNLTAYSLRFDAAHNAPSQNDYSKFFKTFLKYFKKYLFALENKKDGTPHFQGIVWSEEKLDKQTYNRLRAQIRLKLVQPAYRGKGSYAFTLATKPASLAKYCNNKEGKGLYTNLTEQEREEIGEWVDVPVLKKTKKALFNQALDELNDPQTTAGAVAKAQSRTEWTHSVISLYQHIYGNLPRYTQVENWVYRYKSTAKEQTAFRAQKYSNIFANLYKVADEDYNYPFEE
ncbi:MAG: replication protein [Circoviridae sp.]|nr:MAG: replication protein [Circoviridae sp.]